MTGQSLEFFINHNHRVFYVTYESESRQRNRLMSITYDGLPIDVAELRFKDPELYRQIKYAMINNADSHWTDAEKYNAENLVNKIA